MNLPVIGIILGDAAGVGPEIIAKCCASGFFKEVCRPLLMGDARVFDRAAGICGVSDRIRLQIIDSADEASWEDGSIPLLNQKDIDPAEVPFGVQTVVSGKATLNLLKLGVELFDEGKIDGFCFGPLNKAGMHDAGCEYESEHHYLAHMLKHKEPFGEINVVGDMWTTRTTSHIPIAKVSENLTLDRIGRAIRLSYNTLRNAGIENPRIGVAALNPHAGEHGNCGREEIDVIEPAIKKAQEDGINATGPYPSDTVFIKGFEGAFDGVVTMYHDQGQIALKLKGFDQGITIAGGFRIPIVTCGHGTAYDIAGKGIVRTSAFENAVKMCTRMAKVVRK